MGLDLTVLDLTVGWPLALWGLIAAPLLVLLALRSRFPNAQLYRPSLF